MCVWPVLCWHERAETGHRFSSLWSIIQPDGKVEHRGTVLKMSPFVPWALDPIIWEAQRSLNPIPNKGDVVVKKRILTSENDPRKKSQTFLFSKVGGTSSMARCSWSFVFVLFSCLFILKKSLFPSQHANFSSKIWQWSFCHSPHIMFFRQCKKKILENQQFIFVFPVSVVHLQPELFPLLSKTYSPLLRQWSGEVSL